MTVELANCLDKTGSSKLDAYTVSTGTLHCWEEEVLRSRPRNGERKQSRDGHQTRSHEIAISKHFIPHLKDKILTSTAHIETPRHNPADYEIAAKVHTSPALGQTGTQTCTAPNRLRAVEKDGDSNLAWPLRFYRVLTFCLFGWGLQTAGQRLPPRNILNTAK